MPRLREVPRNEAHPAAKKAYERMFGERDPVESPGTSTGTPGNWWTVFASVPDCFDHTLAGFALYAPGKRKIKPELRELAVLRTGYARGSRFVFSQHCKAARAVGLSDEKVQAIRSWQVATCFSSLERAVLAYTDALVLEGGRVSDGVFDALRAELGDTEIFELSYITCTYDMHAVLSRALRLEYDDVDDRISEVPVPARS
jgi:alkylhydroperoxidase family enzyme